MALVACSQPLCGYDAQVLASGSNLKSKIFTPQSASAPSHHNNHNNSNNQKKNGLLQLKGEDNPIVQWRERGRVAC